MTDHWRVRIIHLPVSLSHLNFFDRVPLDRQVSHSSAHEIRVRLQSVGRDSRSLCRPNEEAQMLGDAGKARWLPHELHSGHAIACSE